MDALLAGRQDEAPVVLLAGVTAIGEPANSSVVMEPMTAPSASPAPGSRRSPVNSQPYIARRAPSPRSDLRGRARGPSRASRWFLVFIFFLSPASDRW
jgi:hypothetical protein